MAKAKYTHLGDIAKINRQWRKMSGLHSREDWSAAMVRAATACEIAANYAVRQEFKSRSKFRKPFVDKLLRWANGIDGKITRLIMPLHEGRKNEKIIAPLKIISDKVNKNRNLIVHSGNFMNKREAKEFIADSKKFIEALICIYRPHFRLKEHE